MDGQNFHLSRSQFAASLSIAIDSPTQSVAQGVNGYFITGSCAPSGATINFDDDDMTPNQVSCTCGNNLRFSCGEVGFQGTGSDGNNPQILGILTDGSGRDATSSVALEIKVPAINLTPQSVVISGSSFKPTGTCATDAATVSIDFGNDGNATAGFSTDPLNCTCQGGAVNCPNVTVDFATFGAETISYKTSLTDAVGTSVDDTDTNATTIITLTLTNAAQLRDDTALDITGTCSPNGSTVTITAPTGLAPASQTCTCASNNLSACTDLTESTATLNTSLSVGASITYSGTTHSTSKTITVFNDPPEALSLESGVGNAYESNQPGGLSFVRYGNHSPDDNRVGHNELTDFVDDPIGNADGVRSDSSTVGVGLDYVTGYGTDGGSAGWILSASNDKYTGDAGKIIPVAGVNRFGDLYRGYFIPPSDGIYTFLNLVSPDNAVRIMMSPNECPHKSIPVFSADWGALKGAVHPDSIAIKNQLGTYSGNYIFNHDTGDFFPNSRADENYADGDVYLKANKIYYLEIRYAEGGGSKAFSFGYQRRNIAVGSAKDASTFLPASSMLPFSGADKYAPRQGCQGAYEASYIFSDPEGQTMTYSARVVNADGSAISDSTASQVNYIGLSFNTSTGSLSGTLNGNYSTQKIIFKATDPVGNATESPPIPMIQ
jgi:hypothetical protein